MGYITTYELTTTPEAAHPRVLAEITALYDGDDPFESPCKWYEHEAHAKKASVAVPDAIIRIDGKGEGTGDEWVLYALNGETVKHKRETWVPPPPPAKWLIVAASTKEIADSTRSPITERWLLHTRARDWKCAESLSLTTMRANGCSGPAVRIDWIRLGGTRGENVRDVPAIKMFSDTWLAFVELREVFDLLATFDSHTAPDQATPAALKEALFAIGFVESEFSARP